MSRPERTWDEAETTGTGGAAARWDPIAAGREVGWVEAAKPQRAPLDRDSVDTGVAPRVRRRVRLGRLALVVLGGYLAIMAVSGEMTLLHVRAQADALSREAATLTAQNRVLAQRVKLLHTVSYTDELARTEMGYVSPGEVPLVPVSRDGTNPK